MSTWDDPAAFVRCVARSYGATSGSSSRNAYRFGVRKGTDSGRVAAGARRVRQSASCQFTGSASATVINDVAQEDDSHPLTILYIGDYDPSGLWMSERDIPERLARYGGNHISIRRIALLRGDCVELGRKPAFNVKDKKQDRARRGFAKPTGSCAGSWTRWTPTRCAPVSSRKSTRTSNPRGLGALPGR